MLFHMLLWSIPIFLHLFLQNLDILKVSMVQNDSIIFLHLYIHNELIQLSQRYIFAEADHNNKINDVKRAVRHLQYKLHYDRLSKEAQLYDLSDDPGEKVDVAHKHTQLVDSMLSSLKDFMNIRKTGRKLKSLSPEEIKSLKSLGYLQ